MPAVRAKRNGWPQVTSGIPPPTDNGHSARTRSAASHAGRERGGQRGQRVRCSTRTKSPSRQKSSCVTCRDPRFFFLPPAFNDKRRVEERCRIAETTDSFSEVPNTALGYSQPWRRRDRGDDEQTNKQQHTLRNRSPRFDTARDNEVRLASPRNKATRQPM